MPCFKGLAVSIHTPDGPLPEHSIQKHSRLSRITSYIPVPPAKVPAGSTTNKPEQSTFAISITLLTPGQDIPYSEPKPTRENPRPEPRRVGALPSYGEERGQYGSVVTAYVPLTASDHETIAAYIYFDGRSKEEVATLLRRGEETWVNSRWVSVPQDEGGGLAEREFLFREVGLERFLNGLDLDGKEAAAAKLEQRRLRTAKRRERRRELRENGGGSGGHEASMEMDDDNADPAALKRTSQGSLDKPVDDLDAAFSSDEDSDDEDPVPEAAGQIKVALFRVLASGEIKRGEYSPQFDAHDDDGTAEASGAKPALANGDDAVDEADVDHTTSFAKPKSLDPKLISTQTVTGIDGPEKPYAVFTFLYRGERQLQKMGILPTPEVTEKTTSTAAKRKSQQTDFSKLAPLKSGGTVGFSTFRDQQSQSQSLSPNKSGGGGGGKAKKASPADSDDEDDDDDNDGKSERSGRLHDEVDPKQTDGKKEDLLSPEDAKRQGELADGLRKIKLKRAHSAEPINDPSHPRKSPSANSPSKDDQPYPDATPDPSLTPPPSRAGLLPAASSSTLTPKLPAESLVGSPLKKSRPSLPGMEDESLRGRLGMGVSVGIRDVMGRIEGEMKTRGGDAAGKAADDEEEL